MAPITNTECEKLWARYMSESVVDQLKLDQAEPNRSYVPGPISDLQQNPLRICLTYANMKTSCLDIPNDPAPPAGGINYPGRNPDDGIIYDVEEEEEDSIVDPRFDDDDNSCIFSDLDTDSSISTDEKMTPFSPEDYILEGGVWVPKPIGWEAELLKKFQMEDERKKQKEKINEELAGEQEDDLTIKEDGWTPFCQTIFI